MSVFANAGRMTELEPMYVVLRAGERIAGFLYYQIDEDGPENELVCYVYELQVAKFMSRQGLGSWLMAHLENVALARKIRVVCSSERVADETHISWACRFSPFSRETSRLYDSTASAGTQTTKHVPVTLSMKARNQQLLDTIFSLLGPVASLASRRRPATNEPIYHSFQVYICRWRASGAAQMAPSYKRKVTQPLFSVFYAVHALGPPSPGPVLSLASKAAFCQPKKELKRILPAIIE